MRVYISGPIKGRPDGNREAFAKAAELIRALGQEPVNPHDISEAHSDDVSCVGGSTGREDDLHRYGCYLRADIRVLVDCDAYMTLPEWQQSVGASAEVTVAQAIGLPRIEFKS